MLAEPADSNVGMRFTPAITRVRTVRIPLREPVNAQRYSLPRGSNGNDSANQGVSERVCEIAYALLKSNRKN